VLYRDYRNLRIARDRLADKLRQVSERYRETLAQREALQQVLEQQTQADEKTNHEAELAALRHLARVVALRAGNNPAIEQALRECARAREEKE
jgi:hypothetical protein